MDKIIADRIKRLERKKEWLKNRVDEGFEPALANGILCQIDDELTFIELWLTPATSNTQNIDSTTEK